LVLTAACLIAPWRISYRTRACMTGGTHPRHQLSATSHEIAAMFGGDDIVVRARGDLIDLAEPAEALEFLASLGVDAARLRALGGPDGRGKAEG
jgi:hypothetical protein